MLIICTASNDSEYDMEMYMIISDQDTVYIFVAVVDQDVEYYMRESCLTRLSKRKLHKTLRKHPGLVSLRALHNFFTFFFFKNMIFNIE